MKFRPTCREEHGWRTRALIAIAAFVASALSSPSAEKHDLDPALAPPQIEIDHLETIKLEPQPPLGKDEEARILGLIQNLAKIENPDFGLSPTMSGEAFAPIANAQQWSTLLFTDQKIKQSEDFTELVKLGPKALPYLLKALDDQTSTKLVIKHDYGFGGMWFANELRGNPANETEAKVLASIPKQNPGIPSSDISIYTVKIGDVCFVIIGQIVGRAYSAVRYQPTACIVLGSPTHDAAMAGQVRSIWSSPEPNQGLLNSLLLDFASRDALHDRSSSGWFVASSLQTGAAMRLLYYYPQQTTDLIAARLHSLDVGKDDIAAEIKNGVRLDNFMKAVAWSDAPAIRVELQKIFLATNDPDLLLDTVGSMDAANAPTAQKHLEDLLAKLPKTEPGPFGSGYKLLLALGKQAGPAAQPAFEHYMEHASLQRKRSMCAALTEVEGSWSVDLLAPLLNDRRPAEGWEYPVVPGQNDPRLPIRICDEAADAIAKNFPRLTFKMAGTHADLDRQIKQMQDQISRHDY